MRMLRASRNTDTRQQQTSVKQQAAAAVVRSNSSANSASVEAAPLNHARSALPNDIGLHVMLQESLESIKTTGSVDGCEELIHLLRHLNGDNISQYEEQTRSLGS